MRIIITFGMVLCMVVTCTGQSNTLQKQEACEVLSQEQVAEILDTDMESLINEDMSFISNKRRSVCHIVAKGKIASYNMRLAWKSDKAQANKALERTFKRYLEVGEKDMKEYEEIVGKGDIQILYGTQEGRMGTNHIIRKRFGNTSEIKIEVMRENEIVEMKNVLLEIVNRIR